MEPRRIALLLCALVLVFGGGGDSPAPLKTTPTAATYVYEKDDTAISSQVAAGLVRLNRERNIQATLFEEDTLDGEGQVPDQYKIALAEALKVGLPTLVITADDKVLKVVKDPKTEEQVWGAAQ